ncbi:hypothetical protein Tco_0294292 [Tanacetum coccineum]
MQQFWHTVTYNLEDQTYFFTLDDQVFEVNADLLRDALQITPKDPDHPFVTPPLHDDIVSFIKMLGYPEDLEQVSKMASRFDRPRLALLQVLWGMITNSNVDYAELIWEDFKFQIDSREISKNKKEFLPFPRFTKLIIKYILSHYNNVSTRLQSYHHVININVVLGNLKFANKGKKDPIYGMAIPMEMMSDEIKASADYSNYLEKSMGDKPAKDEEALDHSKKLKGVETISTIAQYLLGMKIATKESKNDYILQQRPKGSGEGSGEERFLTIDDDNYNADAGKKKTGDDKAGNVQAKVSKSEPQVEKHDVQLLSSSLTLSSVEYGNQFINDNSNISLTDLLKEPVEAEFQSLVDVPVHQENPAV